MGSDSPLHQALAAWRAAEHRLEGTTPDDPRRSRLQGDVERIRLRYQALFDAVEDVAGHGAPFTDAPSPADAAERDPAR